MACIRNLRIENFRSIKSLDWNPNPQINCLIGQGDSGKSSILDAIDFCIGNKRNIQFGDDDFYNMIIEDPIIIEVTLGDLDDNLKNLDSYGLYLRGFTDFFGLINDEPNDGDELVITIQLKVENSLEPVWSLVSDRATQHGVKRTLSWTDRAKVAATRIGHYAMNDLAWTKGSVLHRLSDERVEASSFVGVARDARKSFGNSADEKLAKTREIVTKTAKGLGVKVGAEVHALLDHDSISFGGVKVSLHNEKEIPLKNLGVGSSRLLVAGLQKAAAIGSGIVIMDELEYGLEPHRIIRLLGSLGAKDKDSKMQVFLTTHSPVVLRELSGDQLNVVRVSTDEHVVKVAGTLDEIQGALRSNPDAFLSSTVIVCEGASEVGFVRGIDLHRVSQDLSSIAAHGVSLVDGKGVNKILGTACAFQKLGYRVAILRDNDAQPDENKLKEFSRNGGKEFVWSTGNAIESEIFLNLSNDSVLALLDKAVELHGEELINQHIKSASNNNLELSSYKNQLTQQHRANLGKAAKSKNNSWFKNITDMEEVSRVIIATDANANAQFKSKIESIFKWAINE